VKRPNIDMSRMAAAAIEAALDDLNVAEEKPQRRRLSGARAVVAGAALAVAARVAVKRAHGLPSLSDLTAVPDLVRDRLSGFVGHDDLDDLGDDADDLLADEDYEDEEPEDEGEEPEDEGDEDFEDADEGDFDDEDVEEPADEGDEDFDDDEPDEPEDGGDDFDDDEPDEPEGEGDEDFDDDEPEESEDDDEDEDAAVAEGESNGRSGRRRTARSSSPDGAASVPTPDLLDALSTNRSLPPALARAARAVAEHLDPVARPPEPPERQSNSSAKASKKRKAARR
jgi:hypothetical protein